MPAIAVATDAKPGTNLATVSDRAPQRVKIDSVWRTHESGDSEIRHNVRSTRAPRRLPMRYQPRSAITDAATAVATRPGSVYGLRAARAPVTISVG